MCLVRGTWSYNPICYILEIPIEYNTNFKKIALCHDPQTEMTHPSEIIIESETYNLKSQKFDEVPCRIWWKPSEPLPWKT